MSKKPGERAKFNREHKKRMQRRKRGQELQQTSEAKTSILEAPKPIEDGKQIVTSRLRQLTGDQKTASTAFEIVVYQVSQGEKND